MRWLCCQSQLWYEHDSISVLYSRWSPGMEDSVCLELIADHAMSEQIAP